METNKEETSSDDYDQVEHGWARCWGACAIYEPLKYWNILTRTLQK